MGIKRVVGTWTVVGLLAGIHCQGQGLITTIAGTDRILSTPSPVRSTELGEVLAAVPDKSGNVYLALVQLSQIVRLTPDGLLVVVAGNGRAGYSGDGGSALEAS